MRQAGKILGQVLSEIEDLIKPGITTLAIDQFAEKRILELGGLPGFKGYNDFPNSICANINDVVVHGIPNQTKLENGDIFTVDCGVIYQGFYSDSAITVLVKEANFDTALADEQAIKMGQVTFAQKQKFINTAYKALEKAIEKIRPGIKTREISGYIEDVINKEGYGIVRDLSGHGIGKQLHEDPFILNFRDRDPGITIQPGMTFAIEPIITMGDYQIKTLSDKWTIVTVDGSLAAQVEHTILITEKGAEILSKRPK